jgi:hypothetical protein
MVGNFRPDVRARLLPVSLMVLGALACGKSKSPVTATSGAALHIVSAPVHAAQVGNRTS